MTDPECTAFLQWALPRLAMRWPGFRRVRGQVCKRISRRIGELGLSGPSAYRDYLEHNPGEWTRLDGFCRITISRFYRDRALFEYLHDVTLPDLAGDAAEDGTPLRVWTAGCASGEEPYTLAILWHLSLTRRFPTVRLMIEATDADPVMLARARSAVFDWSSLRDLPREWVQMAFEKVGTQYRLLPPLRQNVNLREQDIRRDMPGGPFRLILCRNLLFTYYADEVQHRIVEEMLARLTTGGILVLGRRESLPEGAWPLERRNPRLPLYRKRP